VSSKSRLSRSPAARHPSNEASPTPSIGLEHALVAGGVVVLLLGVIGVALTIWGATVWARDRSAPAVHASQPGDDAHVAEAQPKPAAEQPEPIPPTPAPVVRSKPVEQPAPPPTIPPSTPSTPPPVDKPPPAPQRVAEPKPAPQRPAPAPRAEDKHGTSVKFLNNPEEAARKAAQGQKLMFLLHISGNFEDRQFT
jgi:outer membrane biosynthesis protein TonB